jgi:aminobenzoyl-glutamate transport protein
VEWLGNLLPHPVTLFFLLAVGIVLPVRPVRLDGAGGGGSTARRRARRRRDGMIRAVSLLNGDGLRRIFTGLVTNFTSFAPLGVVLVAMLGVGVAERPAFCPQPCAPWCWARPSIW